MENLKRQFDKIAKPKQTSSWTSGWKKLSKLTKMTALETNDNDKMAASYFFNGLTSMHTTNCIDYTNNSKRQPPRVGASGSPRAS